MKTACLAAVLLAMAPGARAYSVLTHEAIIDTLWEDSIRPVLERRYPGLTPEQLKEAHAYCYGGAIIQDMGYYPFGSKLFSDLAHYVRSGDFAAMLVTDAAGVNELAFGIGALAHYAADTTGHPEAINRAVPILYPKMRARYGDTVTYEDDPSTHLKTEFGFDVLEVAKGHYASEAYHDFIGFKVSKPLLERAFRDTYAIELKDIFASLDLALGTYRRTVSNIIPEMTKVAWRERSKDLEKSQPGITRQKFMYNLSRSSYEKEWGNQYEKPGCGARFLAILFHILPRVGPFRALSYKMPNAQSEALFMKSFNDTVVRDKELLGQVSNSGALKVVDKNLDTGEPPIQGNYKKADQAYEKLMEKIADKQREVSPALKADILQYYRGSSGPTSQKAARAFALIRSSAS
jgi:hypothetical protein